MRRGFWIASLCFLLGSISVRSEPQRSSQYTVTIGQPDQKLLPEGAALCVALGISPSGIYDDDVILEQSQYSTYKSLWIGKTVSGDDSGQPDNCLRPIAIMTYGKHGVVHVCHEPDEDDTVTALDLQRLQDVAARLNQDSNKTLAKHQWIMDFKSLWRRVNL